MMLLLAHFAIAQSATSESPETLLGELASDRHSMRQGFTPVGHLVSRLAIRFMRRHEGRLVSSVTFEVSDAFGVPDAFCVGYYAGSDRRQVFVSMEDQSVTSYLLDYDGKSVHVLYEAGKGRWYGEGGGRGRAMPTWNDKGQFGIRELFWAKTKPVHGEEVPVKPYLVTRTVLIKGK